MPKPRTMETNPIEKIYYTIGEVATMFKVATSAIRFWENDFGKLATYQNQKGERKFTRHDLERTRYIVHLLKVEKYTHAGALTKFFERYPPNIKRQNVPVRKCTFAF